MSNEAPDSTTTTEDAPEIQRLRDIRNSSLRPIEEATEILALIKSAPEPLVNEILLELLTYTLDPSVEGDVEPSVIFINQSEIDTTAKLVTGECRHTIGLIRHEILPTKDAAERIKNYVLRGESENAQTIRMMVLLTANFLPYEPAGRKVITARLKAAKIRPDEFASRLEAQEGVPHEIMDHPLLETAEARLLCLAIHIKETDDLRDVAAILGGICDPDLTTGDLGHGRIETPIEGFCRPWSGGSNAGHSAGDPHQAFGRRDIGLLFFAGTPFRPPSATPPHADDPGGH